MSLGNPIRLTLRTELPDGRIVDMIIPFSVPVGMTLAALRFGEPAGSEDTSREEVRLDMEQSLGLRPVRTEEVGP